MSLPTIAEVLVNCVPVNCIPSPESPANRIVTVSSSSRCLSIIPAGGSKTALMNAPFWILDFGFAICCQRRSKKSQIKNQNAPSLASIHSIHYLSRERWQIHRRLGITLGQVSNDVED